MLMIVSLLVLVLAKSPSYAHPVAEDNFNVTGRVIGGKPAPDGVYPYQISLRNPKNAHICGGSIISTTWMITAAHCIYNKKETDHTLVVGTNFINSGGSVYNISEFIWHEGYGLANINDVGLIKTFEEIKYSVKVQPIPLSDTPSPFGTYCVLSGWGVTSYPSKEIPNSLQHVGLTIINTYYCQMALPGYPVLTTNLCTFQENGKGSCRGDSGGPLVSNGKLIGIVSWGIPCANGYPDVFTSVFAYRSWIRKRLEFNYLYFFTLGS